MRDSAEPDLVKITEIFLIPSSFLVAALGTADSNPHRACVSLIGLIVSGFWLISSREALAERRQSESATAVSRLSRRVRIMSVLPVLFFCSWIGSLVAHIMLWNQPLSH